VRRRELAGSRVALRISQIRSVADIRTRFRANWKGYVYEYRILLVLALVASLADMASTIYFMRTTGPGAEEHPVVRAVSDVTGPVLGPILGKAVQFLVLVLVTVFLRRWAVFIFLPIIILYGWAAWYNVWGHDLYYPRLLELLRYLAI
jgi:predicted membrane protein